LEKEYGQKKKKLKLKYETKEEEWKAQVERDFEFELRSKASELTDKRERDLLTKYKLMFEKEKRALEQKF